MPPALLTRRHADSWSIQEHLEPLWLGRVDDLLSGKPRLRDADLTNRTTHTAQHNAKPVEEILRGFRAVRLRLADRAVAVSYKEAEAMGVAVPRTRRSDHEQKHCVEQRGAGQRATTG